MTTFWKFMANNDKAKRDSNANEARTESPVQNCKKDVSDDEANQSARQISATTRREIYTELRFKRNTRHKSLGTKNMELETWIDDQTCPKCNSDKITLINSSSEEQEKKYKCHECLCIFEAQNEDDNSDGKILPISVWMQCWYLLGITDSTNYISAKLNLDHAIIKEMIAILQKIFNARHPKDAKNRNYEQWLANSSESQEKVSEYIKQHRELIFNADVATAPTDTAEYRKQKTRKNKSF